ncbi:hypothetical protein TNIN_469961 [Trichonephila inaurata madagascariensis]|uniref:Uncharacterized protein n=1 Tax=Trichonephila inaurata madagascariensis TaxID=2747483 RepID=A0A8X6XTQ3_9ARAC|nr:hypothetical protein TNIN_469961 [Trichonephila inaurata madagascariensis]
MAARLTSSRPPSLGQWEKERMLKDHSSTLGRKMVYDANDRPAFWPQPMTGWTAYEYPDLVGIHPPVEEKLHQKLCELLRQVKNEFCAEMGALFTLPTIWETADATPEDRVGRNLCSTEGSDSRAGVYFFSAQWFLPCQRKQG